MASKLATSVSLPNGIAFFAHSGELAKAFDLIARSYEAFFGVTVIHTAGVIMVFDASLRLLLSLLFEGKGKTAKAGEEFSTSLESDDDDAQEGSAIVEEPAVCVEGGDGDDNPYEETQSIVEQAWELFETFRDKSFKPSDFASRYEGDDYSFSSSSTTVVDPADITMVAPPEIPPAKFVNVFSSDAHLRKPDPLPKILADAVWPMLDPEDIRCVVDAMLEAPLLVREVVEVVEVPEPKAPSPYAGMHITWADLPVKPVREPDPPEETKPEEKRNGLTWEAELRIEQYKWRKARAKGFVFRPKIKKKPQGWLAWLWSFVPAWIRDPIEKRIRSVLGVLASFWSWVPVCLRQPIERRVCAVRDRIELAVTGYQQRILDGIRSVISIPTGIKQAVVSRVDAAVDAASGSVIRGFHSSLSVAWSVVRMVKDEVDDTLDEVFGKPEESWVSSIWNLPWRVKSLIETKVEATKQGVLVFIPSVRI